MSRCGAADEQGAFDAIRRDQVGGQDVAQAEWLQVLHVERMCQPAGFAEQFVGTEEAVGVQVQEGAQRVVLLAVGRFTRQVGAVVRGIDDQAGAVGGGVAQHQRDESGGESLAEAFEEGGPGDGLGGALVELREQGAEFGGWKGSWQHGRGDSVGRRRTPSPAAGEGVRNRSAFPIVLTPTPASSSVQPRACP
ncbi:hypothetical protein CBM2585_B50360 [Cupriavidus taiwanensis]|nr:hypothetical protein CBM2585_B50360 [Cupriavidus taiwanensis]